VSTAPVAREQRKVVTVIFADVVGSQEVRQTDASYNMRQAPFARGWFVGDYVGLDTDGADFLPFWTQPFDTDPANAFVRRVGLVSGP
jgi:hypothetical protein